MDPWASILNKAGDYGPWGLVIAALSMALAWSSLRNTKLQDMRADDAKTITAAFIEHRVTIEQLTKAMSARTETMGDWSKNVVAVVDAMRSLQAAHAAFLQAQADRDRDARQFDRDRGAR